MASALGLLLAFGAALAFGVQYVPVKTHEIFDGITFQWFMCNGILMVGVLLSMFFGELGKAFSLRIVFGGMLWALSNYAVLPLVKLLGIGIGFSLYHFVNLVCGYITGRFGLFGMRRMAGDLPLCDFGCVLILISFVIMIFVEDDIGKPSLPRAQGLSGSPLLFDHIDQDRQAGKPVHEGPQGWRQRMLGVALALLAGGLAGIQAVPAALHNQDHPEESSTAAIFPQTLGIWISSSMIYLVYSSIARLQGWDVPHSSIRPAYLSGAIWAAGFALMIGGIKQLGYGLGYTLDAVGPIVVASFLSIFVFKEISGKKALTLYLGSFICQLIGVILITRYGSSQA